MPNTALPLNWRKYPERYNLVGNTCETCKTDYFPARIVCPNCRRKGKLVEKAMPREGTILSYTKLCAAPRGFELQTPYYLAIIDLGNNARVLSQIIDTPDERMKVGAKVKKVFRKINDTSAEGIISYGYKFKVIQ